MTRTIVGPLLALGLVAAVAAAPVQSPTPGPAPIPERIDSAANAKIREEGLQRSQVMRIEHVLTDVYGPRVTGTPNHENAGKWAIKEMESFGLKNGKMEPWNWGHEGWLNEYATGHIITPVQDNLVFEVAAWTPSTKGVLRAPAVNLVAPAGEAGAGPTDLELAKYFAEMAPKVRNAIVLVGAARVPPFVETEPPKRRDDETVRRQYDPDANAGLAAGRGNRAGGAGAGRGAGPATADGHLSAAEVNTRIYEFLMKNGAALRVDDAYRQHGQITAFNPGTSDGVPAGDRYDSTKVLPTVVVRNEDYGRIARLLADGTPVTLEFNIVNRRYPAGKTSYNATAEIAGTDLADQVVMLGGHLDSWHSATGATDNAIGCAIMMEAVRIIQATGLKPRRTIRVALWGGEEEGLLGSKAYVEQHFGTAESPKPEFAKFDGYFNIDSGTGLVRGASVFGPFEAGRIVAAILKPFEDFKVFGASTTTSRATGGTDSTSFNAAGLPGIGGSQDPIEYGSHTHHTNLDTYERILPDDVKKNAIIAASLVYHLAMRDEMLPRFSKAAMPGPGGQ